MTTIDVSSVANRLMSSRFADLAEHRRYFPVPTNMKRLIDVIEDSDLTGKGGASFPTASKLRAVLKANGTPIVVVNGSEGEPVSGKDAFLLQSSPHLVLDGAMYAAAAIRAKRIIVCIKENDGLSLQSVTTAIAERKRAGEANPFDVELVPDRFISGEASALVNWINSRNPRPLPKTRRIWEGGVRGRPTLVDNVETLAHITLIANHGANWYRSGASRLLSVAGDVHSPGIYEAPYGSGLDALLDVAGARLQHARAVLVGGYFGSWLTIDEGRQRVVDDTLGCGVVLVLPKAACGVRETARVLKWMAGESAQQCGMCVNGLASIAEMTSRVYFGTANDESISWLVRWANQLDGRGACGLPTGAVTFLRSALHVFESDFENHRKGQPCTMSERPFLPLGARR